MIRPLTRSLLLPLALALLAAPSFAADDGAVLLARLLAAPPAPAHSLPAGGLPAEERAAQASLTCGGAVVKADGSKLCCKMDEVVSCKGADCRCSYSSTCSRTCTKTGSCTDRPCN